MHYHIPIEALGPDDPETRVLLVQGKATDWYERFPPGTTAIQVVFGETNELIEFNAQDAEYGWNTINEFEIDSTQAEVWISGASDKKTIYADAIRWVLMTEKR